jgi:hypothetical protein
MPKLKIIFIFFFFFIISCKNNSDKNISNKKGMVVKDTQIKPIVKLKIFSTSNPNFQKHLKEAKEFLIAHPNFNDEKAIFIDMKIPSYKYRFIIFDLKNSTIVSKGLVAHGSGCIVKNANFIEIMDTLQFSNTNNSFCTSLGKYKISESYKGTYGKAYKLDGLDVYNSNARLRNIVLHQYYSMPLEEKAEPICYSLGCPMLNKEYFSEVEKIIDESSKHILMDIYY